MATDVRITFASNRGPVSFVEKEGGFDTKRGAGGLAGALDPVARGLGDEALWVSAATSEVDRAAIQQGAAGGLRSELGYRVEMLDIDPGTYVSYYDEISNRMLWFANHCLWDEVGIDPASVSLEGWDDAFVPVNRRFAETVVQMGHEDDLVFFQDYHLSLAPAVLREMSPDHMSLHFTHSSFCNFESGLGRLPDPIPGAVIDGMLGADLVGFHEPRWAKNFLDCCKRLGHRVDQERGLVDLGERVAWVRCYPIPIDAADLIERGRGEAARDWARRHREWAAGRVVVVRADRMEPSKNIVRGFEAFGKMLDDHPELRDRVCFLACVYPSRQDVDEYRRYAERIHASVEAVNARYPDSINLFTEDDFDRSLGALIGYDVLLVNSIMDGMNLVSKEGPALNESDGVLVLSKGAGSYGEMSDAAVVIDDPFDVSETATRLFEALGRSGDQRHNDAELLRTSATARVPEDWLEEQIADLSAIRREGRPLTSVQQPGE